ncbi:hypothetical protein [Natribacillus halophilus]|uniref:Uncharacterized protein n=1 Tax=Natribacillus halophilus TaxID=549003 RepID=A0A1G8J9D0_9BACI|nr:hypothetical protein [Natribacillus halophilus]SDI27796.1 hypothetical protein SAMN04488123_101110 [Natribacillus halophilus]
MTTLLTTVMGNIATTPHEGDPFLVTSLTVLSVVTIVYFIFSMFKDNN